jgi:hypothetical protein
MNKKKLGKAVGPYGITMEALFYRGDKLVGNIFIVVFKVWFFQ